MYQVTEYKDESQGDFNIRWRMPRVCNANCSYCAQHNSKIAYSAEMQSQVEEVAQQVGKVMQEALDRGFKRPILRLVGGETTVFDLRRILSYIPEAVDIHITTNTKHNSDYYIDLAKLRRVIMVFSWHQEIQSLEKYLEKVNQIKPYLLDYQCETVSTLTNQEGVMRFVYACDEQKLNWKVDPDSKETVNVNRLFFGCSEKEKKLTLTFVGGQQETWKTRALFLKKGKTNINMNNKRGVLSANSCCSYGQNYLYIDTYQAYMRDEDGECTRLADVSEFQFRDEWLPCHHRSCNVCGTYSLLYDGQIRPHDNQHICH